MHKSGISQVIDKWKIYIENSKGLKLCDPSSENNENLGRKGCLKNIFLSNIY